MRKMNKPNFTISDLAREFDITTRAIRFYEDKGLLAPRREGRNRIYSAGDRARLSLILRGKRVGFSLDEIGEMLNLYKLDEGNATQLAVALKRFQARIQVLQKQRQDIDDAISELEDGCTEVRRMLSEREGNREKANAVAPSAGGYGGPIETLHPENTR